MTCIAVIGGGRLLSLCCGCDPLANPRVHEGMARRQQPSSLKTFAIFVLSPFILHSNGQKCVVFGKTFTYDNEWPRHTMEPLHEWHSHQCKGPSDRLFAFCCQMHSIVAHPHLVCTAVQASILVPIETAAQGWWHSCPSDRIVAICCQMHIIVAHPRLVRTAVQASILVPFKTAMQGW
jgi:hypothetical protein